MAHEAPIDARKWDQVPYVIGRGAILENMCRDGCNEYNVTDCTHPQPCFGACNRLTLAFIGNGYWECGCCLQCVDGYLVETRFDEPPRQAPDLARLLEHAELVQSFEARFEVMKEKVACGLCAREVSAVIRLRETRTCMSCTDSICDAVHTRHG